uniref:Zinc transporter ZIP1 n=1 Tax=Cacopsylla melanoneura TaxID=428564 RepID=A0A8D8LI87_9HEMI
METHDEHMHNATSVLSKLDSDRKALISAKILSMVILGVSSFVIGILPLKLAKMMNFSRKPTLDGHFPKQPLIISLLLCFGGGVLLFTTFIHLQPEVRESIQSLYDQKLLPSFIQKNMNVHVADVIFCIGFFFVYLVEETVHFFLDKRSHEQEDEAVLHRTMSLRKCAKHPCDHEPVPIIPRVSLINGSNNAPKGNELETGSGSITTSTQGLLDSNNISTISCKNNKSPLDAQVRMTGGPLGKGHHHHVELHSDEHSLKDGNEMVVAQSFRGLLAVLALSFHAIFEGLAVGLEGRLNNVWYLFGAIATHKLVIAFCVGIELVSSRTKLPLVIVYVGTFAIVTPLGIGLGVLLSEEASAAGGNFVAVALQGMAAGTLLYVIFFEVLQRERSNTQSGFLQLLAIMAGFAVMFALQFLHGHEHSHSHSHSHSVETVTAALDLHNHSHDEHGHDHDHSDHSGHNHAAEHDFHAFHDQRR